MKLKHEITDLDQMTPPLCQGTPESMPGHSTCSYHPSLSLLPIRAERLALASIVLQHCSISVPYWSSGGAVK